MKWEPGNGLSVDKEPTERANGMTRDRQGRLVICHHDSRRVTRTEPDGRSTVIADGYGGQRLNRPNDLVVKSDGSIYFTDPMTVSVETELNYQGVYRVSHDLKTIQLLLKDFSLPNGLVFSPDERLLYVNDSVQRHVRVFEVRSEGLLDLTTDRVFAKMRGERPGAPDGMKVDVDGNLYCTGPGGIWVLSAAGEHLGTILTDQQVTNLAWGGPRWGTLYFTTFTTLGKIETNARGIRVPLSRRAP